MREELEVMTELSVWAVDDLMCMEKIAVVTKKVVVSVVSVRKGS